ALQPRAPHLLRPPQAAPQIGLHVRTQPAPICWPVQDETRRSPLRPRPPTPPGPLPPRRPRQRQADIIPVVALPQRPRRHQGKLLFLHSVKRLVEIGEPQPQRPQRPTSHARVPPPLPHQRPAGDDGTVFALHHQHPQAIFVGKRLAPRPQERAQHVRVVPPRRPHPRVPPLGARGQLRLPRPPPRLHQRPSTRRSLRAASRRNSPGRNVTRLPSTRVMFPTDESVCHPRRNLHSRGGVHRATS